MLLTSGYCGTCSTACKKIKEQYGVLANCPVNKLLPSLYAKDVITLDDKKIMEAKLLEKDRMMYFLDDVLIRSLNMGFSGKYNRFLTVLEESDDSSVTGLIRKLGELAVHHFTSTLDTRIISNFLACHSISFSHYHS